MRIVTKRIQQELPTEIIKIIWDFYDESYQGVDLDDYQFLQIKNTNDKTILKMWQEEPSLIIHT